ncbi:hypothetical protein GQ597_08190 [Gilliamella sp. Pra-s65]|uniref:hypothetical protein n=1 Tax=unclassified Gilliamella TaxID=2685620 RepID=UPI001365D6DA|nr:MULTISPECIES: hypothetical protein [unclassified Gilliamella]MWN90678.1 hypothetical protein [Gilliamella sp. Pra-s65]MWP73617.1 hypothetical protein [Gilliamella sp. Pra-s52]
MGSITGILLGAVCCVLFIFVIDFYFVDTLLFFDVVNRFLGLNLLNFNSCICGIFLITSLLYIVKMFFSPVFSIVSNNKIIVSRKFRRDICYDINSDLNVKITMRLSRQHDGINRYRSSAFVNSCLLCLTFKNDKIKLNKRWVSGFYSYEETSAFIYALKSRQVQFYFKGYGAKYFSQLMGFKSSNH